MIENVTNSGTLNLQINTGEGLRPSPPPSSEITNSPVPQTQNTPAVKAAGEAQSQANVSDAERKDSARAPSSAPLGQEELKQLEESIQRLNEKLNSMNREIQFKVDKDINRNYISIIDKKTKEIIKEVPPREIRRFIAVLRELDDRLYNGQELKEIFVNTKV